MFLRTLAILFIALPLAAQVQTQKMINKGSGDISRAYGIYAEVLQTETISSSPGIVLPRPTLNGLELRKGHMIHEAQALAQKQLDKANKELPLAEAALKAAKPGGMETATENAEIAENRQKQAQLRVTQLANQLDAWESDTLATHEADPTKYKVDWVHGQIVNK